MKPYPSIQQSLGLLGLSLLIMLISIPIVFTIPDYQFGTLIHYLVWTGSTIWIGLNFFKKKVGYEKTFDLQVKNPKLLPWILLGTAGVLFGIVSPVSSVIPVNDYFKQIMLQFASMTGVLGFIMIVIAAPICEELIFRGIILDGFLKRYNPVKSIVVSSLLFGAIHLNPWQFVAGTVIGIFAGWVYYRSRSISYCMIIHAFCNLIAFVSLKFTPNYEETIGMSLVEYYGSVSITISVIGIALSVLVYALYELDRRLASPVTNASDEKVSIPAEATELGEN
jgi:uncharacterized protein